MRFLPLLALLVGLSRALPASKTHHAQHKPASKKHHHARHKPAEALLERDGDEEGTPTASVDLPDNLDWDALRDPFEHSNRDGFSGNMKEGELPDHLGDAKTLTGGNGGGAGVKVPLESFYNPEGKLQVPTFKVHTQHASCPDAQCPRAKMENLGFATKGYNLLFGNPMPEQAGVDPGLTKNAGSPIFDFKYSLGRETPDGRYQMPDYVQVIFEKGCMISFDTTMSSSTQEYTSTLSQDAKVEGQVGNFLKSVEFSASNEYKESDSTFKSSATMKITSSADCLVYHARLYKFSEKPRFTANFYAGIRSLGNPPSYASEGEMTDTTQLEEMKAAKERYYRFFNEFGTHWMSDLRMGSRFGLTSEMTMEGYAKTQSSGYALQAAVKVTWTSLKEKCPGNGCGSLERQPIGAAGGGAHALERLEPIVKVIDPGHPGRGAAPARTKLIFPTDPEYAEAKAEEEAQLERERGSVGLGGGMSKANSAAETFEKETTKASMTSIGAAPADDATNWAAQTEDENMPVRYSLRSICEMVQLGLYRLYGQQYTSHELGVVDPEAVSYGKTNALDPDDPIDESPGALKTQEYMEQFKFDLKAAQDDPLTAKQMDNVVDFCAALQDHADYCYYMKTMDNSLTCKPPSDKKIAYQIPQCWSDRDCEPIFGMDRKCSNSVCRLNYERVVDIVIAQGSSLPSCDNLANSSAEDSRTYYKSTNAALGGGPNYDGVYEEVTIHDRDNADVKKNCPFVDHVKICMKKSSKYKEPGICRLMLSSNSDCAKHGMLNVPVAGRSWGNINPGSRMVYLCYSTEGCEQTKGQGPCTKGFVTIPEAGEESKTFPCTEEIPESEQGYCWCQMGQISFDAFDRTGSLTCASVCQDGLRKPAITDVKMTTADSGQCPDQTTQERVPRKGSLNGDLNENRMCDSVFMCQSKAQPVMDPGS